MDTIAQIKPAIATVVNFGVSGLHLRDTEKTEKPNADRIPNKRPKNEPLLVLPNAIIIIPIAAIIIAIQTLNEILSFKNKKPKNAVMKGMAAKHNKVIAAEVFVIDQINVIMAIPSQCSQLILIFQLFYNSYKRKIPLQRINTN